MKIPTDFAKRIKKNKILKTLDLMNIAYLKDKLVEEFYFLGIYLVGRVLCLSYVFI